MIELYRSLEFYGKEQVAVADLDGDCRLAVVANVEEFNRLRSILAVVWFESPLAP